MLTVAQKSLRRCSLYFCILSALLACLIGIGTGHWELSLLVIGAAAVGYFYTDVFGWFSLPRVVAYVLMVGGAVLAVGQFLGDGGLERINAVGNLLIFVQLPLIFQKKSKRVFEQWGVFLLLELVVAALVNSDLLFGILMIPVLATGVLAMMSLTAFCSIEGHNTSVAAKNDWWTKIASWLGRSNSTSDLKSGIRLQAVGIDARSNSVNSWELNGGRMRLGPVVLTLGALAFTVLYFYTLPRMSVGAFEVSEWGNASIGISDQVSLRYRGTIKPNDSPVLRMQFRHKFQNTIFEPIQPPYLRITVLHQYLDGPTRGVWQRGEPAIYGDRRAIARLPQVSDLEPELVEISDPVVVSISEKTSLRESVACIPPFSEESKRKSLAIGKRDWRMLDTSEEVRAKNIKRNYSFRTYAFQNGAEKRVLPSVWDSYLSEEPWSEFGSFLGISRRDELTSFPSSLSPIVAVRDEMLADAQLAPTDRLGKALHLEQKLAYSPEFTYTLKQSPPIDPALDPIADFLLHRKRGHCEYYASSLAMLMRSMNIPSRLILGFRPVNYNQMGGYYLVNQGHAHAWVEGYFSREEIKQHPHFAAQLPEFAKEGVWVRFDPTPSGEGSNSGVMFRDADSQTLSVLQDFWSEMIMNMDSTRQGAMMDVFGETSENSYVSMWEDIKEWLAKVRSHPILAGLASPRNWFSWRAAVAIFAVGGFALAFYQAWVWMFPTWRLASMRRRKRRLQTDFPFYNRLLQSLRRLGIEPSVGQTPREFWSEAAATLKKHSITIDPDLIAESFYALRYGNAGVLENGLEERIEHQLQIIERVNRGQFLNSVTS